MSLTRFAYTDERKKKDARLFIRRMRDFHRFSNLSRVILSNAKVLTADDSGKKFKNGKVKTYVRYQCASCHGKFGPTLVEVDHIVEMGGLANIKTWDWTKPDALQLFATQYLEIFLKFENHQVLCKACHRLKSQRIDHLWK